MQAVEQSSTTFSDATISDLIGLYINDVGQMRTLGTTHLYALKALQRRNIGAITASKLQSSDIIAHCRERQAAGVCPATVNQDITYLRGPLKMARIMWGIPATEAAIVEAMPLLTKLQLVGKSKPRDRRPTQEELDLLIAHFKKQNGHWRTRTPMDVLTEFAVLSGRRISETCRLRWEDLNEQDRTCLVRDLKDPKRKKGSGNHGTFPLLGRAWDIVMAQPKVEGEPRIFPYNSKTASGRYTLAKRKLGIKNLRLHDNRRECASRMIEQAYSVPEVMCVTLHKNPQILMRTYMRLNPADLHKGPAAKRSAQ